MSTIDLIILGFLMDAKMNAYELANYIEERQIRRFLKISSPAIYKRCKVLFSEGYLNGEKVKTGEQPEKTVYSVNKNGKKRFYELMEHMSAEFSPFYFDCNTFLWNIEKLNKEQGLKMLGNLNNALLNLNNWIIRHESEESENLTFASRAIIKQYRMVVSTLAKWSSEVIEDYRNLKNQSKA